jgi:hypothetical protein
MKRNDNDVSIATNELQIRLEMSSSGRRFFILNKLNNSTTNIQDKQMHSGYEKRLFGIENMFFVIFTGVMELFSYITNC